MVKTIEGFGTWKNLKDEYVFYNIVVHADDLRQWYPIFSREFYVVGACVHIKANLKKYGALRLGEFSV